MSTSTESQATDQRLTALEIKASFNEETVESLNQTIIAQQQQIDVLQKQIAMLEQRLPVEGDTPFRSLRDELPPHY